MVEFFIAKKQILSRKKQSLVSIIGVMIGVCVLTVSLAISNGLDKNMVGSLLSMIGHINVTGEVDNELKEKIESIEGVKVVIPSIDSQSIVKFNSFGKEVAIGMKSLALDFDAVEKTQEIKDKIIEGSFDRDNKKAILIGSAFAEAFNFKLGDKLTIISSQNVELDLEVAGIFQSGFYDYDLNMIIIPLITAQYIEYKNTYDKLMVKLDNPYNSEKINSEILSLTDKDIRSFTWGELNKALLSAIHLEQTVMLLVLSLIVLIAAFLVWIILNTLVREKIKDIGILRAYGYGRKNIMIIFLCQGLFLGLIGIFLGLILAEIILFILKNYGLEFLKNIYYLKNIPMEISFKEILIIVAGNIFIIFLSSIFPAYKASKLKDVEALRHE